jgi:hypothetical protein
MVLKGNCLADLSAIPWASEQRRRWRGTARCRIDLTSVEIISSRASISSFIRGAKQRNGGIHVSSLRLSMKQTSGFLVSSFTGFFLCEHILRIDVDAMLPVLCVAEYVCTFALVHRGGHAGEVEPAVHVSLCRKCHRRHIRRSCIFVICV